MPATPTKRFMNWTAVEFGTQIFTGVTTLKWTKGGSTKVFSGDGDRMPTCIVADFTEPKATLACADEAAVNSCPVGTRGTLIATRLDAKNYALTGGGGLTYTGINGIITDGDVGGAHREYGEGNLSISFESSDGVTNPVSTAAL